MANLAIKGHATRGREVIELLEMLGGENSDKYHGDNINLYYHIDNNFKFIDWCNECTPDSDFVSYTLEEFLEKFPFKVGDKVSSKYLKNYKIEKMEWEDTENRVIYKLQGVGRYSADELQPYKEETMEDKEMLLGWAIESKGKRLIPHKDYEIKQDGEVFYLVKKNPQYPKTYKECYEVIGLTGCMPTDNLWYKFGPILTFYQLLICRDAYWKIAGEQMGLGKPWKPDYNEESYEQGSPIKYVIYYTGTHITKGRKCTPSYTLSFPIEEMRNAFYENFKELIEDCKELL